MTPSFNLIISALFLVILVKTHNWTLDINISDPLSTYPDYICSINKYNVFTLQWKPQLCFNNNHTNCFKEGIPNITIHGIWQNYYTEQYPTAPGECTDAKVFDEDVKDIKEQLDIMWPSYRKKTNFEFWEHEWEKHGTCWNLVNQSEYFQTGLNWITQYDIQNVLADSNIYPSNCYDDTGICKTYPLKDVNDALDKVLNHKSVVWCEDKTFIEQFLMCRDWYGTPIDCPDNLYPENTPTRFKMCADMVVLSEQVYPTYSDTAFEIRTKVNDNYCLDAVGNQDGNGGAVKLWGCWGGPNQQWQWYGRRLQSRASGLCLDIHADDYYSKKNGGKIQLWECNDNDNQQWSWTSDGQIKSKNGMCLDAASPPKDDGAVIQWMCHDGDNQKWR